MDMNVAAWRLHKLTGRNRRGKSVDDHWAVAVSGNWRLTFTFQDHDVVLVDYLDYHQERLRCECTTRRTPAWYCESISAT